ncbi:hypothetical protein E1B28_001506 [Marasmius oreades]|uniref:Uncharacterized protein n=1 Tax=Marasmius oreades TaxID=181124 RepID=A0A9P7V3W2_9AGAR|nr:uncharacterized protein E1B28_001506 [Marasmius oreades]KAG7099682.1 hypothetical protein E1B28_001506 [Marasmius oreades]
MSSHDPMTMKSNDQQSSNLIVNVIARAIGSVGFGLSVVAIGVLWLFPSALGDSKSTTLASLEEVTRRKERETRRRSAPPILGSTRPKPQRISTEPLAKPVIVVPVVVKPNSEVSSIISGNTPRRVYFLEPQTRPKNSRRFSAPPAEPSLTELGVTTPQVPEDVSPRSSSSTLVHVPTPPHYPVTLDPCDEAIESANSDSSSKRSSSTKRSSSLSVTLSGRFKGRWAKRSSVPADPNGSARSSAIVERPAYPEKHRRRSSLGNHPWSTVTKPRPTIDPSPPIARHIDDDQKPPQSESLVSPSSRKVSGTGKLRPSTPQRTQPYAYPYFAEPPDMVSAYKPPTVVNDSLSPEDHDHEKRQKNAQAQASLGIGRKPPRRRVSSVV